MRFFGDRPPPGPFRPEFWRSPLRGPWLTSLLGSILLVSLVIVAATGFLSHAAYMPQLGANAIVPRDGSLDFLIPDWQTGPAWLYALNQGLHVTVGIGAIALLLAKLWSVLPRLFTWPPVRSPAQALERLALLLLVGGALFEFATGIFNVQIYYPFRFNFVVAHFYGAWVFLAALALHVAVKAPVIRRSYRARRGLAPLRQALEATRPEPRAPRGDSLAPAAPTAPTLSRRGLLGLVGAGTAALVVSVAGQAIGGPLRATAFLAPRRGDAGDGPNDFQVNKTADSARVTAEMTGPSWRLTVAGRRRLELDRQALLALPQHTAALPIACVEGWSTTQEWTGVRLADLARMAAAATEDTLLVESLQPRGVLRRATLSAGQVADPDSLLALRVNGVDLSMDHGFPARIIVPALPGVHNTKWVASLSFGAAADA